MDLYHRVVVLFQGVDSISQGDGSEVDLWVTDLYHRVMFCFRVLILYLKVMVPASG